MCKYDISIIRNRYFFRRLVMNPAYYHLEDLSHEGINAFLSNLVDNTLADLEEAQCVLIDEATGSLEPLTLGRIASYYYLDYSTVMMFANSIGDEMRSVSLSLSVSLSVSLSLCLSEPLHHAASRKCWRF